MIKDFEFIYDNFTGMSTYKIDNSVTIRHIETGVTVTSNKHRHMHKNKNDVIIELVDILYDMGYDYSNLLNRVERS